MEPNLEPVSQGVETALTIWEILAPILTAAFVWVCGKLGSWVSAVAKNERVGGMLARLVATIQTAVVSVNETAKAEIVKAKKPDSPGGTKITKAEAEQLKSACLDKIKAYWGEKGLAAAANVLGFDDKGIEAFIDDEIERAVADEKRPPENP